MPGTEGHKPGSRKSRTSLQAEGKVTFCSWCEVPTNPSSVHHPGGQVTHEIDQAKRADAAGRMEQPLGKTNTFAQGEEGAYQSRVSPIRHTSDEGFVLMVITTDGYGNLTAEDVKGQVLATVKHCTLPYLKNLVEQGYNKLNEESGE
jgi:hypothetical protein